MSDYIKSLCERCFGTIEFPEHGVGESIQCPHCGEWTILNTANESVKSVIKKIWADGVIEDSENEWLAEVVKSLNPKFEFGEINKVINEAAKPAIQKRFNEILNQDDITLKEIEEFIMVFCKNNLKAIPDMDELYSDPAIKDQYERKLRLGTIRRGELWEDKECGIALGAREKCYHTERGINLYEYRSITNSVSYGGISASIPICKGIRFRLGKFALSPDVTKELTPIDFGNLYLTNQKLLFTGEYGNKSYPLSKIIGVSVGNDFIEIERTQGKNPFFMSTLGVNEWLVEKLQRVLRDRGN